jgi:hypothetical protein
MPPQTQTESEPQRGDAAATLDQLRRVNETFRRYFAYFGGVPVRGTEEEVEAMLQVERTLQSVARFLQGDLKRSQSGEVRNEIACYRENLLRLRRELFSMQDSASISRARLFTREEHLHAAQAWCAAARSTR